MDELLRQPTAALDALFFKHHRGDLPATLAAVEKAFWEALQADESVSSIPVLSLATHRHLPPWSLVRFRGMVQDMGAEVDLCQVAVNDASKRTTLYRDDFCDLFPGEVDRDGGYVERQRFHIVAVPGQSDWAAAQYEGSSAAGSLAAMHGAAACVDAERKRLGVPEEGPCGAAAKRARSNALEGTGTTPSAVSVLPSVSPKGPQIACVVKAYALQGDPPREFRLNNLVEVIGVLHPVCQTPGADRADDDEFFREQQFDCPPGTVRCALHAIHLRPSPSVIRTPRPSASSLSAREVNAALVAFLQRVLRGDRLAATYVLLNMVSGVYDRQGSLILGNFPLNLVGPEAAVACQGVQAAWELLVEQYCGVSLDLVSLQDAPLLPNYQPDGLQQAALQLPHGTLLAIDETALAEGRINDQGLRNLAALKSIAEEQTVKYAFQFHEMEINTDCPSIVFSTTRSLLSGPGVCVVPLCPEGPFSDCCGDQSFPFADGRALLARAHRDPAYRISDAVRHAVEEDLAAEMAAHPERFNRSAVIRHNTVHLRFTLARLLVLSWGESELTLEAWREVRSLEAERLARLQRPSIPRD